MGSFGSHKKMGRNKAQHNVNFCIIFSMLLTLHSTKYSLVQFI